MRTHRAQKAALTRAVKTGDPFTVRVECRRAMAEWDADGWPDDWSDWQRALQDVTGNWGVTLEDLRMGTAPGDLRPDGLGAVVYRAED